jgi:hypothetical protein
MFRGKDIANPARHAPDLLADRHLVFISRMFPFWVLLGLAIPFGVGMALTGSLAGGLTGLLWAGAPVPVFTPARAAVRRVREELIRGTRVQVALDSHERPMHRHHEKLVIVDGEVAFVGGIDLTSLGGDRFI